MSSEEVDLDGVWNQLELQKMILKAAAGVIPSKSQSCALALTQIGHVFLHPRLKCLMVAGFSVRPPHDIDMNETISQFTMTLINLRPTDPARAALDHLLKTVSANETVSLEMVGNVFSRLVRHVELPAFRLQRIFQTLIDEKVLTDADAEQALDKIGRNEECIRPDQIAAVLKNELQSTAGDPVATRRALNEPCIKTIQAGQYRIVEQAATNMTRSPLMSEWLACGPPNVRLEVNIVKQSKPSVPSVQSLPSPVLTAISVSEDDEFDGLDNPELNVPG